MPRLPLSMRLTLFFSVVVLTAFFAVSACLFFALNTQLPPSTLIEALLISNLSIALPLLVGIAFMSYRYAKSVHHLVRTMDMIESIDDFSMQCDASHTGGALAQLAAAFNRMLMRLRSVQQQVAALENELAQQKNTETHVRNLQIQQTLEKLNDAQAQVAQSHQLIALGRVAIDFIQSTQQDALRHGVTTLLSGNSEKQPMPLDLPLAALVQLFEGAYTPRIRFDKDYALNNTPVLCQVNDVLHVVLHILSNAVQAIAQKGTIIVTTAKVYDQAIISISDNGQGIEKSKQAKIFTPFFTTKKGYAPGLGLSLSLDIIQKYGGTLTVESKAHQGTRVMIALPITAAGKVA